MARYDLRSIAGLCSLLGAAAFTQNAAAQVTPRAFHSTTLMPDRTMLVVGGELVTNGPASNSVQLILENGSVIAAPNANFVARASHTATFLPNGEVLVAGGSNGGALASANVFNPAQGCWHSILPSMGTARFNHTASLLFTGANAGKVLICGGNTSAVAVTNSCEFFTPVSPAPACGVSPGSFSAAPSLAQGRALHSATVLANGEVWFAGGTSGSGVYLNSTERFDPGSGLMRSAGALVQARAAHTATLMGDGQHVFIAGGIDGLDYEDNLNSNDGSQLEPYPSLSRGYLRSTEMYDSVGDHCALDARMFVRRQMHSAALKANGALTAFGGLGGMTNSYINSFSAVLNNSPAPTICVSGGVITSGGGCTTQISVPLQFHLADYAGNAHNVTGVIHDGQLYFAGDNTVTPPANPTIPFSFGTVEFSSGIPPAANQALGTGLYGLLNGTTVQCEPTDSNNCGLISQAAYTITVANGANAGTIAWTANPIAVGIPNISAANSGSIHYTPSFTVASAPGDSATIDSGATINANVTLQGLPPEIPVNATLSNITITLSNAAISVSALGNQLVTMQINNAVATGPYSGTVITDPITGNPEITINNVSFSQIVGQVVLSSYTAGVVNPINMSGLSLTTLVGSVRGLRSSTLNLTNLTDTFSAPKLVAVINAMSYGDDEEYSPGGAAGSQGWAYAPNGGHLLGQSFGQTSTLDSRGSVHLVGGMTYQQLAVPSWRALSWSPLNTFNAVPNSMSTSRQLHTATTLPSGKILIAGGSNGSSILTTSELLTPGDQTAGNPTAPAFTPTGPMKTARQLHTATLLLNGRVLAAGGASANAASTGPVASAEIYYPDTGLWIPTSSMSYTRQYHTATILPDGNVLALGGYGKSIACPACAPAYLASAEIYYSTSGVWQTLPNPMPTMRANHTATLLQDGRVLVVGGEDASHVLNTYAFYDWQSGLWTSGVLPASVRHHSATLLQDGEVLVSGGDDGNWEQGYSWLYNPAGGWTPTATTLPIPVQSHTATLLPNGSVLVAGGAVLQSGGTPKMTTQIFSPMFGWALWGGGFNTARAYHTMTMAQDGTLYALGGYNGTSVLASAESHGWFSTDLDSHSQGYPPSPRRPLISAVDEPVLIPGKAFTVTGSRFHGQTEASGGGAGAANSDYRHPRLILQAMDGSAGTASQGNSGYILNLSTYIYQNANNLWSKSDSSLTVTLPATLPYGWYRLYAGANDQVSESYLVQAGPPKPAVGVSAVTPTVLGSNSIRYCWPNPSTSDFDGFNIYAAAASGAVWVSTVTKSAFSPTCYTMTGLVPGSPQQAYVSPYDISGDYLPLTPSATSYTAGVPPVANLSGLGASPSSVRWTWNNIAGLGFRVYCGTCAVDPVTLKPPLLATVAVNLSTAVYTTVWLDTGLATNTSRSVKVSAYNTTTLDEGAMSLATAWTLAAAPGLSSHIPNPDNVTTNSMTVYWDPQSNPAGTSYQIRLNPPAAGPYTTVSTYTVVTGLSPGQVYTISALSFNGAPTPVANPAVPPYVPLGSSATLANPATNLAVTGTTPASISLSWSTNGNSTGTVYQLNYTTVAVTDVNDPNFYLSYATTTTASPFTITNLWASLTYSVRVRSVSPRGVPTAFDPTAFVSTVTYNGGAAAGSLAGVIHHSSDTVIYGSVGLPGGKPAPRFVRFHAPPLSFPSDTTITISTFSIYDTVLDPAVQGSLCGGDANMAFVLSANPPINPTQPVFFSVSYDPPGEPAGLDLVKNPASAALLRYNAARLSASDTCVPEPTTVDMKGAVVPGQQYTLSGQVNDLMGTYAYNRSLSIYQVGDATATLVDVPGNSRIYPNPLYAGRNGGNATLEVPPGSSVRIFTLRGELVNDLTADATSGLLYWNATNRAGRLVASGVYLVDIEAAGKRDIRKLAVIR